MDKDDLIEGAREMAFSKIIGGPGVIWKTKEGRVFFQMKRIDYKGRGNVYYIFRVDREAIDEEGRQFFEKAWKMLREAARLMQVALFDIDEVGERISEAIKGMPRWKGQRDFDIELYDHASGETQTVTKGITLVDKS